jgi:hypothetical protein
MRSTVFIFPYVGMCERDMIVAIKSFNQIRLFYAMQGAFGRGALSVTSFFMYVGLGLSLLGGGLALPFGIYVLIVQRQPEGTLQDSVNPPNSTRQVRTP